MSFRRSPNYKIIWDFWSKCHRTGLTIFNGRSLLNVISFRRPKKFTLKGYKRYWFTYKDLHLLLYKTRDGYRSNEPPAVAINLRGCEVTPEVNLTQGKFNIKLEVPSDDGIGANSEMWIRCDTVSICREHKTQVESIETNEFPRFRRRTNMPNGWLHAV